MKRIAFTLLASAAALVASTARADTHVRIGVNVGAPVYRPVPPVVAYVPAPTVVVAPSRGYWKEVQVKTWVPERWIVRHNRWGRAERHCEPGYFTYTTQRVWVEARDFHDRHDHHRNDHGRYGYSSRRDSNHRDGWRR